ncbi:protein prenyltransferase alpha subunit repeat-containing protein 1-like isoform X2 [Gigantopelta aegis]|nr:protein prenyltransferase alpha subunit repeat-containing protein 1-like isoform X2 [Gigantopelta aegis]XP_041372177.1 protein prenyltransferase alpha subunit repeat-containing protein 1-like isoform X2 [Gigantopelta aegis]XP_041372184.1 protein prenyltransferase alpha subunit repeat-containing protein 1-like isoform X2 [Gigantopelta aegis]XP_041372191.1 protein prenyltransferase alpha subunit repeat-containing protein 1-like isoform X2 [Gigantopelta aegis]XP_041372198.1 protein prenyltransf
MEPSQNKSPLILLHHKLGFEMWCIPILYKHVYDKLLDWHHKDGAVKFIEPEDVVKLTRAVLLVNPECYTAWNIRKEMVEADNLTLTDDLKFGALILSKHPKSAETFIHRRWLLQKLIGQSLVSSNDSNASNSSLEPREDLVNLDFINVNFLPTSNSVPPSNKIVIPHPDSGACEHFMEEMTVCLESATKYACNYYAWSHRIWVLQSCFNCRVSILLSELHLTQSWASSHVSDHSGFQYRQFLLSQLRKQTSTLSSKFSIKFADILQKEMCFIIDLLSCFPEHETLWYHRRFVFHTLVSLKRVSSPSSNTSLNSNTGQNDDHEYFASNDHVKLKKIKYENDRQTLILEEVTSVQLNFLPKGATGQAANMAKTYKDWIQKCVL